MNFVLVDLAGSGSGFEVGFDRIIRLTVAVVVVVVVVVEADQIDSFPAAVVVAVGADRINSFAVLGAVLYSHQTCCR